MKIIQIEKFDCETFMIKQELMIHDGKEGADAEDFVGSVIELKSSDEESFKINNGEIAFVSETIMKKFDCETSMIEQELIIQDGNEGAAAEDFVGSVIELKSSDEESFKINGEVAIVSETIMKKLIDADGAADSFISLTDVTGKILGKVIEYMKFIVEAEEEMAVDDKEALNAFDKKFIGAVDMNTLFDLMRAAYYLKVEKLLDLTCRTVADLISGMTAEQIRESFDMVNDFTDKEEEQARKGIPWAFQ